MKRANNLIFIIVALIFIEGALGQDEFEGSKALQFDLNQSVDGFGVVSSYRHLASEPLMLNSHSRGSGFYSYESLAQLQDEDTVDETVGTFYSSSEKIELQEKVSAAYSESDINYPGSFETKPIKSLWSDSVSSKNTEGIAMKAGFNYASALTKEMTAKISRNDSFEDILRSGSTGSFAASMKLDARFNGTGQIGMFAGEPGQENTMALIDEYYRGTYAITKKMDFAVKAEITTNEDDWLPCCSGGFSDMNSIDQRPFKSARGVFDCTCSPSL